MFAIQDYDCIYIFYYAIFVMSVTRGTKGYTLYTKKNGAAALAGQMNEKGRKSRKRHSRSILIKRKCSTKKTMTVYVSMESVRREKGLRQMSTLAIQD
jgi:hypothetical protein